MTIQPVGSFASTLPVIIIQAKLFSIVSFCRYFRCAFKTVVWDKESSADAETEQNYANHPQP